jgi:hypothetical protein
MLIVAESRGLGLDHEDAVILAFEDEIESLSPPESKPSCLGIILRSSGWSAKVDLTSLASGLACIYLVQPFPQVDAQEDWWAVEYLFFEMKGRLLVSHLRGCCCFLLAQARSPPPQRLQRRGSANEKLGV